MRLQSDERLVALVRRGNHGAFEALVSRYESRLLSFCRHMLGSTEDAEDVLQEVFASAFNAMLADERPINVRPWLYRIARNRSLNHLRRAQPVGMDSMDVHLSDGGLTTADRAHRREEFRQLIADVQELPESQRTALLLREIDALSYDQIAEAMETTVPSVKSLLVRARVSLAEAAEARLLTCEEVRYELGEVAEGLKRTSAPVRRHLRTCQRCATFRSELRKTNKALAVLMPVGPLLLFKKLLLAHFGTTAAAGGGGSAAVGTAAGAAAGSAGSAAAGSALTYGVTTVASKAAAGLAAAAIVTAGAVEVKHVAHRPSRAAAVAAQASPAAIAAPARVPAPAPAPAAPVPAAPRHRPKRDTVAAAARKRAAAKAREADQAARKTGGAPVILAPTPAPGPESESDTTTLPSDPTTLSGRTGGTVGPTEQPEEQTAPPPDQSQGQPAPAPDQQTTPPPPDGSQPPADGQPAPTERQQTDDGEQPQPSDDQQPAPSDEQQQPSDEQQQSSGDED